MTEAEALTAIKTECKILSDALTDTELLYFLNKNSKDDGSGAGTKLYNLNRAIYEALGSAITALPKSFSRGGVSSTLRDLQSVLKEYKAKAMVGNSDFPSVGIGVVIRDLSS
jgi:hypothetical protein